MIDDDMIVDRLAQEAANRTATFWGSVVFYGGIAGIIALGFGTLILLAGHLVFL